MISKANKPPTGRSKGCESMTCYWTAELMWSEGELSNWMAASLIYCRAKTSHGWTFAIQWSTFDHFSVSQRKHNARPFSTRPSRELIDHRTWFDLIPIPKFGNNDRPTVSNVKRWEGGKRALPLLFKSDLSPSPMFASRFHFIPCFEGLAALQKQKTTSKSDG